MIPWIVFPGRQVVQEGAQHPHAALQARAALRQLLLAHHRHGLLRHTIRRADPLTARGENVLPGETDVRTKGGWNFCDGRDAWFKRWAE